MLTPASIKRRREMELMHEQQRAKLATPTRLPKPHPKQQQAVLPGGGGSSLLVVQGSHVEIVTPANNAAAGRVSPQSNLERGIQPSKQEQRHHQQQQQQQQSQPQNNREAAARVSSSSSAVAAAASPSAMLMRSQRPKLDLMRRRKARAQPSRSDGAPPRNNFTGVEDAEDDEGGGEA